MKTDPANVKRWKHKFRVSQQMCDVGYPVSGRAAAPKPRRGGIPKRRQRKLSPLVFEPPTLEIAGDSKTVLHWLNGHAKKKTLDSTVAATQNQMWTWWSRGVALRRRVADRAVHIFRELNEEADVWTGEVVKGREEEWIGTSNVGPKLLACAVSGMTAETRRLWC